MRRMSAEKARFLGFRVVRRAEHQNHHFCTLLLTLRSSLCSDTRLRVRITRDPSSRGVRFLTFLAIQACQTWCSAQSGDSGDSGAKSDGIKGVRNQTRITPDLRRFMGNLVIKVVQKVVQNQSGKKNPSSGEEAGPGVPCLPCPAVHPGTTLPWVHLCCTPSPCTSCTSAGCGTPPGRDSLGSEASGGLGKMVQRGFLAQSCHCSSGLLPG